MRILLIGIDPELGATLVKGLHQHGYEVDQAHNGSGGKRLLDSLGYQFVILTCGIPDLDVRELCRTIREKDHSIFLLLLAVPGLCDVFEGYSDGVDDYLVMPADAREIVARVNAKTRRSFSACCAQNLIKAGDITIDPSSRSVNKAGRRVAVTPSEYLLLEYLMRNRNKVLTKEEIANGIWGLGKPAKARNLIVHMTHLRGKLGNGILAGEGTRPGSGIYTVSGRGYLFLDEG